MLCFFSLFHITDWFTTILGFADASPTNSVDGLDQWDAINGNSCPSKLSNELIALH